MRIDPTHFDTWFEALNDGKHPFPWQRRLFFEWLCPEGAEEARWPGLIRLPTASGKTALIDLAVLALAAGSPCARRRVVFVVNRRVVVDEAALRAQTIANRLRSSLKSPADPLYEVGRSLVSLGGNAPLAVATLRGGIPGDDGWARSPAQPAVVLSTVDQAGSRLLFRAYGGHGPRSWPIHAGLLGRDTLMIVDEAHCAAPFCETARAITERWQDFAEQPIGTRLSLVRMSATPGEKPDFELDDKDRDHQILKVRLSAPKPAELVIAEATPEADRTCLIEKIVERTQHLLNSMKSGVVGIVVNRVADARAVFQQLQIPDDRKLLLTGRVRGWERDRLLENWLPLLRAGSRQDADAPLAVVATQCIEVGANLDFDYLVTELASLDALRQRFGRVDRIGDRVNRIERLGERAAIPGVIVATSVQIEADGGNAKFPDRVYGNALSHTWAWLREQEQGDPPCVDFGIDALESLLPEGEELQRLCQDLVRAYTLLPAHLDVLAQTNPPPQPEPEISAFLHGTTRCSPDVTTVWRCDLPEDNLKAWPDRVTVQPPVPGEGCPVPIWDFLRWLGSNSTVCDDAGDIEALAPEDKDGGATKPVLRWRGISDAKVVAARDVAPGDTVIVPSAYGGCDQFGWNPVSSAAVSDIGDAVAYASGRRPVLRLTALSNWLSSLDGTATAKLTLADLEKWAASEEDAPDVSDTLIELASARDELPDWLRGLAVRLSKDRRCRRIEASGRYAIAGARGGGEDLGTAGDGSSLGMPVVLADHCVRVRGYAKRFAKAIGLPTTMVSDIALAGVLHDVGKADPRFQAWLHGGDEIAAAIADAPLAKSVENPRNRAAIRRARQRARYPQGARHEVQSLALIQNQIQIRERANDWDLVLHLVLTHHGFGRPFVPVVTDPNPVSVALIHGPLHLSCTSNHRCHSLESGIVDRFWRLTRRYGWWGLAWLEAIVRLADHRRSEDEERREVNSD